MDNKWILNECRMNMKIGDILHAQTTTPKSSQLSSSISSKAKLQAPITTAIAASSTTPSRKPKQEETSNPSKLSTSPTVSQSNQKSIIYNVCNIFLFISFIISNYIWLEYDAVDDGDNVDGLEADSYFGFAAEVVGEAVAVIVGDCGLLTAGSVIGDDINDEDWDYFGALGFVIFFVERKYLFSFYI